MGEAAAHAIRLVIADDHPLFRGALKEAVAAHYPLSQIQEVGTFDELHALLDRDDEFDLVLLDLTMPGARGFSGLIYLRAQYAAVPVMVVSGNGEPTVIRSCLKLGASGFIPKTMGVASMRDAIGVVLAGGTFAPPQVNVSDRSDPESDIVIARLATLTPQQVRVLMMLSEGRLNKQIAYELSVSEATVKAHVSAILQKLGVESRTQAVIAVSKVEAGLWTQA